MQSLIRFLTLAFAAGSMFVMSCSAVDTEKPTKEIVEQVLAQFWAKAESTSGPKTTLEVHSVKFGKPAKATAQEVQVEGIPEGNVVTPAIIDFSVRTFHTRETQVLRRVREARVYKDKFDEWAVMTGSVRGQDQRSTEPAAKSP